MKKALLFCLGSIALTSLVSAQQLTRVSIRTLEAPSVASGLTAEGYDVLEGSIEQRSFEMIVSPETMGVLLARGYNPRIIEVGRPFYEIQADRLAAAGASDSNEDAPPVGYSDLSGIYAQMSAAAAAFPSICEFVNLTTKYGTPRTEGNRPMFAIKISDNVGIDEDEPSTLLVGAHHCRELGTPVALLYAIEQFTTQYGIDPNITNIVNENEIWIAPVWNPDGYSFVFSNNNLWRKNRHVFPGGVGVDLNRNYPFGWTAPCSGSTNPGNDTYKGPSAGSEAETQTMIALSEDQRFAKVIDYHSFGRETLWEYACNPHPLSTYLRTEAMGLSTATGYGTKNRPPSAEGEHFEWQLAQYGNASYLIEIQNSFQPAFTSSEAEAVQIFDGIDYFINREIPMSGLVTDAISGLPVAASVSFQSLVFTGGETNTTNPKTGRYSAFLPGGNYVGTMRAPGYRDTCFAVNIIDGQAKVQDMTMMPLSACPTAAITHRSGFGNPDVYTATPAVIGQPTTFTVDTQGFQFATIFGAACPQVRGADFGQVLINVDSALAFMIGPIAGPIATTSMVVTNDASMCGITIYTQAKIHNVAQRPFKVTNAQDMLVGN